MGSKEITRLLVDWSHGDARSFDKLAPLVYKELHRLAQRYRNRERPDHTLQATDIVHETYLRLVDVEGVDWQGRAHFYAIAARIIRRVLVAYARSRGYIKRGGDARRVQLDESQGASLEPDGDLVALDDALRMLAGIDHRKADVIELRFFGGLTVEETAEVLKVSTDTVKRDWRLAKSWLLRELSPKQTHERSRQQP
jgi:RNA polymerase sigma factor (TIGR02999 family)